jgi:hypothetical protein
LSFRSSYPVQTFNVFHENVILIHRLLNLFLVKLPGSIWGGQGPVNHLWATACGGKGHNSCLTALIAGKEARRLSALGEQAIIDAGLIHREK